MMNMQVVGSIVYGKHGSIMIRQKSEAEIELGDLLVVEQASGDYSILQVYDLQYASQIPDKNLEMISGMKLEGFRADLDFMDPALRNYILAEVKSVVTIKKEASKKTAYIPKTLPQFMNNVRPIEKADLDFIESPKNPLFLGNVRSGSKMLDVGVHLNGEDVFTHHLLIPATTGRGKSNLLKVMLWSVLDKNFCGILVLDPHDEYYGRHSKGLKDHPNSHESLVYYSPTPVNGSPTLVFDFKSIKPWHFKGVVDFTQAQHEALIIAFHLFRNDWLRQLVIAEELEGVADATLAVLKRKLDATLGIYLDDQGNIQCRSAIFSDSLGSRTVKDIQDALESGKKVIVDTSRLADETELLIGSIILNEVFNSYKRYKLDGSLDQKPVISIVVEEAPRVLSQDVLKSGDNIFSTIAREGRKFKVGLTACTQLTSIIPKTVLANMNTKIILGNELSSERTAIIDSASQDLSSDDQSIASLDKGEAIVSSNFAKFAIPIKVPFFDDFIKNNQSKTTEKVRVIL
jgi:DNA helicase HerA-like ATPase